MKSQQLILLWIPGTIWVTFFLLLLRVSAFWNFAELSWMSRWMFFIKFREFQALFPQIFFILLCSLLLFGLLLCICWYACWCPHGLYSFFLHSFCYSGLIISMNLSANSLILSSGYLNLLLSPCGEILISVIVVFNSRVSDSFFIISTSLLIFSVWWDIILIFSFSSLDMVSFSLWTHLKYLVPYGSLFKVFAS